MRFRFVVREAIYSYFLFLIQFPNPISISASFSYSGAASASASASVARARSASDPAPSPPICISPRRIVIIFRRFDDLANFPGFPDSSHRARAHAASPRQRNAKWNNTKSDIIFENNAEKTRKTEEYCENARKYGNVRGEYMPPENLKNVKVAARKIGRGV